jgi:hypothetical protein
MIYNNAKSLAGGVLLFGALALSACGTYKADRAVSGGLIGAGGGAAIGAIAGNAGAAHSSAAASARWSGQPQAPAV